MIPLDWSACLCYTAGVRKMNLVEQRLDATG
jgi:hypothetical protein